MWKITRPLTVCAALTVAGCCTISEHGTLENRLAEAEAKIAQLEQASVWTERTKPQRMADALNRARQEFPNHSDDNADAIVFFAIATDGLSLIELYQTASVQDVLTAMQTNLQTLSNYGPGEVPDAAKLRLTRSPSNRLSDSLGILQTMLNSADPGGIRTRYWFELTTTNWMNSTNAWFATLAQRLDRDEMMFLNFLHVNRTVPASGDCAARLADHNWLYTGLTQPSGGPQLPSNKRQLGQLTWYEMFKLTKENVLIGGMPGNDPFEVLLSCTLHFREGGLTSMCCNCVTYRNCINGGTGTTCTEYANGKCTLGSPYCPPGSTCQPEL